MPIIFEDAARTILAEELERLRRTISQQDRRPAAGRRLASARWLTRVKAHCTAVPRSMSWKKAANLGQHRRTSTR